MKKLCKGAYATDIHFGKKSNSEVHNQDCLDFLEWFCEQVRSDSSIDYVAFLGDWNENRSALNISTLDYSYRGAKLLNDLGLPVFFVVGNHDLYHRHTREVYSTVAYNEFENFTIVDEPLVTDRIHGGALFSPYLFHDEYSTLDDMLKIPFWAGHFEFKGFIVTGYNVRMPTGPDPEKFKGPKHIISGHFHKRQQSDNIVYMGNTFPMDFGDAGDSERGMMVYDHISQTFEYKNWAACPMYVKTKLSDLLDGNTQLYTNARVKCVADVPISYEESTALRSTFMQTYSLREFSIEESIDIREAITDTEADEVGILEEDGEQRLETVDELIVRMLTHIQTEHIDNELLVEQYRRLT